MLSRNKSTPSTYPDIANQALLEALEKISRRTGMETLNCQRLLKNQLKMGNITQANLLTDNEKSFISALYSAE